MASIKVCLHSGIQADEIRRFSYSTYEHLVSKIREVFPSVGEKELSLQWKDGDDFVTFSSEEELQVALKVVKDGVLFVLARLAGEEHHFDCPYLDKLHHCPYLMKCLCSEEPHHSPSEDVCHGCPYLEMFQGSGCPYLKRGYYGCPYLGNWLGASYGGGFRGRCPLGFGNRGGCPLGFGAGGFRYHRGCPLGFGSHGIGHHGGCPLGFGSHGFGHHKGYPMGFGYHDTGGHDCCDKKEKGKCPVTHRQEKASD